VDFFDQYTISRVIDYYTSLKILFDRIRMLKAWVADIEGKHPERYGAEISSKLSPEDRDILRRLLKQIIYDCFICFENARISLHCLLERGRFHDQSIFVCLLSEIRAFAFSRSCPDNVEYIRRRLAARLQRQSIRSEEPIEGIIDEFERYSHPAYRNIGNRSKVFAKSTVAIMKMKREREAISLLRYAVTRVLSK
jgi:hypothetical protein